MHRSQRITFEMPRAQQQEVKEDPDYLFNTMILELVNNWEFVIELMDKFYRSVLKEVDPLERDWINFIIQNKIQINIYGGDSNRFMEANLKNKSA